MMRGIKLLAVVGLVVTLAGLGMVTANAQQSCDPTGPFRQWILGNLGNANVIVIAIDNSGSIREAVRLPTEKTCAINAVQQLRGKFFAVLSFNSSVTVVQRPTNDTNTLINAINSIQDTSNNTLMDGAIDDACQFTQPVRPNGALLLLTDGIPTAARRPVDPTTAAEQAASNFKANCSTLAVIGVDIKEGSDEDKFLGRIASPGAYGATSSKTGGFAIRSVPTLTEWGLIALAVLLAGSLAFMIRRRLAPRPAGA
jgi:hypothetical protein